MGRRKSGLSAHGGRAGKKEKPIRDEDIDFSDIPELTDEQLKSMKRVGRPPLGASSRHLIAIRVDPEVLEKIRALASSSGKGYQSLINEILAKYVKKKRTA